MRPLLLLPLALLLAFVGLVGWRLSQPENTVIASRMVGKPLPDTVVPAAFAGGEPINLGTATGRPRLINFFASWCAPCVAEAPLLLMLQRQGVRIEGIAVRDRPADAAAFLVRNGNPYVAVGADSDSRVQMLLGASGVPETFLVDADGIVRRQHVGPIMPDDVAALRREWQELRR